ncbi:7647_t:CDS:1, partial [Diversispora eburnea]
MQKKKRPYINNSTTTYCYKYDLHEKFTVVTKKTNSLTNFFRLIILDNNDEINNETASFIRMYSEYNENDKINKSNETSENREMGNYNKIIERHYEIMGRHDKIMDKYDEVNSEISRHVEINSEMSEYNKTEGRYDEIDNEIGKNSK